MIRVASNTFDMEREKREKNTLKDYFAFGEVLTYFFRKRSDKKPSINLRLMHGINKISMLIFLVAVIYLIAKRFI